MKTITITEKTKKELTAKQLLELKTLINYIELLDIDEAISKVKSFYFITLNDIIYKDKIVACCAISKDNELMFIRTNNQHREKGYCKLLIQTVLINHSNPIAYSNNTNMIKILKGFDFVEIKTVISKLTGNEVIKLIK
jgi:hypothetical protein